MTANFAYPSPQTMRFAVTLIMENEMKKSEFKSIQKCLLQLALANRSHRRWAQSQLVIECSKSWVSATLFALKFMRLGGFE